MTQIIEMLQSYESYCTSVLGYDRAEAKYELDSSGRITLWLKCVDTLIQAAPYQDQVHQCHTFEADQDLATVRAQLWEYIYRDLKKRDERELAFVLRRMAQLADTDFSSLVGKFIAGRMKASIEEAQGLIAGPRGQGQGQGQGEEQPQPVAGPTEVEYDDEPF